MLSNKEKIQEDNKFWETVHKELVHQMDNVNDDLIVGYTSFNNFTIMGKMTHTKYNMKIEFCTCGTTDVYERVKISVIGKEGLIDSIYINFSDVTGEESKVAMGMYPAYWRGCELLPHHYLKLAVRICDFLHLYEQF